jgi:hypothetical protein
MILSQRRQIVNRLTFVVFVEIKINYNGIKIILLFLHILFEITYINYY